VASAVPVGGTPTQATASVCLFIGGIGRYGAISLLNFNQFAFRDATLGVFLAAVIGVVVVRILLALDLLTFRVKGRVNDISSTRVRQPVVTLAREDTVLFGLRVDVLIQLGPGLDTIVGTVQLFLVRVKLFLVLKKLFKGGRRLVRKHYSECSNCTENRHKGQ
jgi:hypothetical protein